MLRIDRKYAIEQVLLALLAHAEWRRLVWILLDVLEKYIVKTCLCIERCRSERQRTPPMRPELNVKLSRAELASKTAWENSP